MVSKNDGQVIMTRCGEARSNANAHPNENLGNVIFFPKSLKNIGAGDEIRTHDPNLGKSSHRLNIKYIVKLFQIVM